MIVLNINIPNYYAVYAYAAYEDMIAFSRECKLKAQYFQIPDNNSKYKKVGILPIRIVKSNVSSVYSARNHAFNFSCRAVVDMISLLGV